MPHAPAMLDAEGIAEQLLRGLGPVPGALAVAERMGVSVVAIDQLPAGDGASAIVRGQWQVMVRRGLSPVRRRWAVAHELAEIHLARLGVAADDLELLAERVAAGIVMPRKAYASSARRDGQCFVRLSHAFLTTQTAAVLRLAEVGALRGAAVVHRTFRMERGVMPDDADLVVTRQISDAIGRVAVTAL